MAISYTVRPEILERAKEAFKTRGVSGLTMGSLAEACGVSRRGLYHHFGSKEEAFRAVIWRENLVALANGDAAAADAQGDGPTRVITAFLDARFGQTRRDIAAAPYGREMNETAFAIASDVMIEMSYETNRRLTLLLQGMADRGELKLREGLAVEVVGRLIGDGARGVNQARPPIPNHLLAQHYREITEAILFGCATGAGRAWI